LKIGLTNGKVASDATIRALEAALGCDISDSFKSFVLANDGAKTETNTFKIAENNDSGVNQFIPVGEILKERSHVENLSRKAYPVAWAEGGNYIFLDEAADGAVFFWDHELPESPTLLASSFSAFLDLLEPFDTKKVELKPGQVKRVWIDPEFAKRLKK
jgi:hypothetical protein